ncbi:hypothetical protein EHP00_839 [Ecytonucleospora hepatopenaei]|uniref:Uncharacterized protein n=1 Tax=Ecytonucleospora hepatopenaei TaxID=646526 RepID=A0A1W0E4N9_9MICR|nr:hypothetical protein EHP00_839 [Ecytonucleospora hepatopenaei]
MKNIYDAEQIQKEAKKKRDEQEQADATILEEAERIEQQNYQKAKQARLELERAADTQQQTTQTMRAQGEKIGMAKTSAEKVNRNAKAANDLAIELEDNRSAFSCNFGCITGIKKWCSRDAGEEEAVKGLKMNRSGAVPETKQIEENEYVPEGEEYIKGQHNTDKEMSKILHNLKKINAEADTQDKLAKQQKTDLEDIQRANAYTQKQVEKTDKRLNDELQK